MAHMPDLRLKQIAGTTLIEYRYQHPSEHYIRLRNFVLQIFADNNNIFFWKIYELRSTISSLMSVIQWEEFEQSLDMPIMQ